MNEPKNSATSANQKVPAKAGPRVAPLSATRMGAAVGMTGVLFYPGCILTMSTVSRDKAITFFNSLLHGLDVGPILRTSVSTVEVVLGIVSTFVLGWFAGALIAGFYNWGLNWQRREV
jgi:hypothetical protein